MKRLVKAFCKARLYILALPYVIGLIGFGMNQAVLVANGDKFPVMINSQIQQKIEDFDGDFIDDTHCLMTSKTHLNFLADFIDMKYIWVSPGDILIGLGDMLAEYALGVWMILAILEMANAPDPVKI